MLLKRLEVVTHALDRIQFSFNSQKQSDQGEPPFLVTAEGVDAFGSYTKALIGRTPPTHSKRLTACRQYGYLYWVLGIVHRCSLGGFETSCVGFTFLKGTLTIQSLLTCCTLRSIFSSLYTNTVNFRRAGCLLWATIEAALTVLLTQLATFHNSWVCTPLQW